MTSRLLIIACSAAKRRDPGRLPAIERYDGPAYKLLRKAKAAGHMTDVYVLVISAEHGLIDEDRRIEDYDRRMTPQRAEQLAPEVSVDLFRWFRSHPECRTVHVDLGRYYRPAIVGFVPWCQHHDIAITEAAGGIGQRLTQLKTWLEVQPIQETVA